MLNDIYDELARQLLPLGYGSDELVFGCGDEHSRIVLVGEAPGRDEVAQKKPFVGKAGKNLDEFLLATGLRREALFITNVVKFRPYKLSAKGTRSNRPPTRRETELCAACLAAELSEIAPALVITLGNTALRAVSGDKKAVISALHGEPLAPNIFALYHPASVIYRRELAAVYMDDLAKLAAYIAKNALV